MGHDLIRFMQAKLMAKKSEIRLGVIFREHTSENEQKLRNRIRKVINTQMKLSTMLTKQAVKMDPSPLFLSEDEDDQEQESISRETSESFSSVANNLGDIRKK
jgi:DNA-directed RNA polymerase beta' subunit